jgi:hypothetical protein
VDYTPTQQQIEQRATLRELIGDMRNFAALVGQQPNITRRQRDAVSVLLSVSGRVSAEFADSTPPTIFERLLAAMEE